MNAGAREVSARMKGEIAKAEEKVPRGYKRTEVGVIPKDWNVATLLSIAGGRKENFDDGDWVEAEYLTDSGVRLLQTGNIGVGEFVDKAEKKYISVASFDLLRCKEVRPGDLLICRLAEPAGRACITPDLGESRMITSVDVTIFRPLPKIADARYLLYVFSTPWWFSEVADRCGGSTRSRIARGELAKMKVALPSISEQRAIATALSDVDALIAELDKLIAKKRAIKTAAMQQLLTGRIRLPGFTGKWETKRLGDVAELRNGYAFKSNTYSANGKYIVITISNVQDGFLDLKDYNSIASLPIDIQPHQILKKGDILISLTGNVGRVCKVTKEHCLLNQRVGLIEPRHIHNDFLIHVLRQRKFIRSMILAAKGGAQGNLGKSDIVNYEIYVPIDQKEQAAIAQVLTDMDAEIAALEARRDKTRAIKQGMMQLLLTGRIRLV